MPLTLEQMTNGLTPEHDYFFPSCPDNPEMRESTSVWLFEENGKFGFPRFGIEGEAHSWDNRLYHCNFALEGGRVLLDAGRGPAPDVMGPAGKPSVFGAGPVTFQCLEPFRRWHMVYEGTPQEGTIEELVQGPLTGSKLIPVKLEVELVMETPAWVQDYSPEKVAKMSKKEQDDAQSMGIGWRLEHLCRGQGELTIDGTTREFNLLGSRIKRQSVRPLDAFRGHCWQSAVFPDGRAFGTIAYPASDTAPQYNIAYVVVDGRMYPARATRIPYIQQVLAEGDDVTLELESELGTHRIGGTTCLSTFRVNNPDMAALGAPGFTLQQGGARYTWDGMTAYGMIERSATGKQMAEGYA
ncbi:hypothetical protein [Haliea sp. E17]|uniref:hypothetical protein n=1 Tax=Haliea sp. E17 TaxID=3401576 RepID=UPI003AAFAD3B